MGSPGNVWAMSRPYCLRSLSPESFIHSPVIELKLIQLFRVSTTMRRQSVARAPAYVLTRTAEFLAQVSTPLLHITLHIDVELCPPRMHKQLGRPRSSLDNFVGKYSVSFTGSPVQCTAPFPLSGTDNCDSQSGHLTQGSWPNRGASLISPGRPIHGIGHATIGAQ